MLLLKKGGCGVKPCQVIRRGDKIISGCPDGVLHVLTKHFLLGELQIQAGSWGREPGRAAELTPALHPGQGSEDPRLWKSFSRAHKGVITALGGTQTPTATHSQSCCHSRHFGKDRTAPRGTTIAA